MAKIAQYHPESKLLAQYNAGKLPRGQDLAVATHLELCDPCRQLADRSKEIPGGNSSAHSSDQAMHASADATDHVFEMFGKNVQLPPSIAKYAQSGLTWKKVADRAFSALLKADGGLRCALVHLQAGCVVPRHYHTATETTLMIDGTMCDDFDCYGSTDFVVRNSAHEHSLMSDEGCFCLMVVDGPIYFSRGWARLRNPLIALRHFHAMLRKYFNR